MGEVKEMDELIRRAREIGGTMPSAIHTPSTQLDASYSPINQLLPSSTSSLPLSLSPLISILNIFTRPSRPTLTHPAIHPKSCFHTSFAPRNSGWLKPRRKHPCPTPSPSTFGSLSLHISTCQFLSLFPVPTSQLCVNLTYVLQLGLARCVLRLPSRFSS